MPLNRSVRAWIGIAAVAVTIALAALYAWQSRESPLLSDPLAPRSWGGGRALTRTPVASSDSPREALYSATYSPLLATAGGWETTIELPRAEFVPAFEMVEGNAADGFQAADFRGRVKCLTAAFFAPDPSGNYDIPELDVFDSDGTPMTKDGQTAAGIGCDDVQLACGWQEGMTSMLASVELDGCENPQVRNRSPAGSTGTA